MNHKQEFKKYVFQPEGSCWECAFAEKPNKCEKAACCPTHRDDRQTGNFVRRSPSEVAA